MRLNNIAKFVVAIALPQVAGLIGSLFTISAIPVWYVFLEKSSLTPPNFVFGPVWTLLYVLMGLAFFLVWQSKAKGQDLRFAALIFFLQLSLNTFWSVAFFGLQNPLLGLIIIGSLWITILVNIFVFAKISKWAGMLLWPYLAWVSFAAYLNYSIWILN